MRFATFFAGLLAVVALLGSYVHRRAAGLLDLSRRGRRALAALLIAGIIALPAGRLGRALLPDGLVRSLSMLGWMLALAIVITAVLLLAVDVIRALANLAARAFASTSGAAPATASDSVAASASVSDSVPDSESVPAPVSGSVPSDAPVLSPSPPLSRRAVIHQGAAASAFLIGGGSSLYGALLGRHDYSIEEVAVPIPGLPRALDGFSIVQLSDIHIGLFVGEPELAAAEDLVRKARGDLIALTGDLVDFDPRHADLLGRFARRLAPLAREGVVAVPGNHDHFAGVGAVISALRRGGADVLVNRGRPVGGPAAAVSLLGVDDVWARRSRVAGAGPDLARALATVPGDLPRVLLCHNPVFFPEAAGDVALQLSGHTHGGQVNVLLRPADWVLPDGYVAGLYQRGASRLYVNRGFGTAGPPARIGSPPEITRLVLVSA
ncbi:MAG: metallophosphoesterase [Polyangiaceae bacterium]|nr:metallophosphoesterase [Polyangiaceae bacterium]